MEEQDPVQEYNLEQEDIQEQPPAEEQLPEQEHPPEPEHFPATSIRERIAARRSLINLLAPLPNASPANPISDDLYYDSYDEDYSSSDDSSSEYDEPPHTDGLYDDLTDQVSRYSLEERHYIPTMHVKVPFSPETLHVELTHGADPGFLTLRAAVTMEKGQECTYAVDPKAGTIVFIVTRRSSVKVPGTKDIEMIVAGCSKIFPAAFDWNLGVVVDSGERDGVWVCLWPRMGKQLPEEVRRDKVVDIVVDEDDFGFSLEGSTCS